MTGGKCCFYRVNDVKLDELSYSQQNVCLSSDHNLQNEMMRTSLTSLFVFNLVIIPDSKNIHRNIKQRNSCHD